MTNNEGDRRNSRLSRHGLGQLLTDRFRNPTMAENTLESPKTPELTPRLRLQNMSTTRITLPHLEDNSASPTRSSIRSPVSHTTSSMPPGSPRLMSPRSFRSLNINSLREAESLQRPPPAIRAPSSSDFTGLDPEEQQLASIARAGRRRKRRRHRFRTDNGSFRFKFRSKKVKSQAITCVISGIFLLVVLCLYLGLALSNQQESEEFHVLLIMLILIATSFFCYAVIRLSFLLFKPLTNDIESARLPSMVGPGGFANPPQPIRVVLASDEDAVGIESEATKVPPPAYGLWRESVRVDPNRIFWQRNEQRDGARPVTANTVHRPPSYISDDGVGYVVEAAPRSVAPTTDVPLAPHPSEAGRLGRF